MPSNNNNRYEQVPIDDESNHFESSPQSRRPKLTQQQTDLEATFDINEEEENQQDTEYHQLLPTTTITNTPLRSSLSPPAHQVVPMSHSNDGVFSNMSAKPELGSKMEEVPPTYEEASADATPPYWQTTIITPAGMGDMVLVEGLPVGNIFSFVWNLAVSASFQLVGFMLTYLLHTTHAAKDGARAGLGISLIQYGFYVRSRGTLDEDFDYDGEGHETGQDAVVADAFAYVMMFVGWFVILRAISDYNNARKTEKIITAEPNVDAVV